VHRRLGEHVSGTLIPVILHLRRGLTRLLGCALHVTTPNLHDGSSFIQVRRRNIPPCSSSATSSSSSITHRWLHTTTSNGVSFYKQKVHAPQSNLLLSYACCFWSRCMQVVILIAVKNNNNKMKTPIMNIYARALMWTHPYTSTQFSVNNFQIVELKIDEVIIDSSWFQLSSTRCLTLNKKHCFFMEYI
jgi:hypothetical protein